MNNLDYQKRLEQRKNEIKWINEIIEKGSYCCNCGIYCEPFIMRKLIFNDHHIAGKKNSDYTIPLCPTCHSIFSFKQYGWDERWIKFNTKRIRNAICLRGISDTMEEFSKFIRKVSDNILEGED